MRAAVLVVILMLACTGTESLPPDLEFGQILDLDYGHGLEGPFDEEEFDMGSEETQGQVITGNEYPSAELLLKITGPSGFGYATTAGSRIALSGLVFGKFESLSWFNLNTGASGPASGAPFWQTDGIDLKMGDNVIEVTAQGGGEVVRERIVVTYNPGFLFQDAPVAKPPAVFAGEMQEVHVTIALGPFGNLVSNTLTLQQVDKEGNPIKDLGPMMDDGLVATSGDEIAKDGVYTRQQSIVGCQAGEKIYLRATAQVKGLDNQVYVAKSAIVPVDCVARLPRSTCISHQKTLSDARDAYNAELPNGVAAARKAALDILKADPMFQEGAEMTDEGGLWIQWKDGVLGAVNLAGAELRGGGDGESLEDSGVYTSALTDLIPILSKDVLLLSPFSSEFGTSDETRFIAQVTGGVPCPAYNVSGPHTASAARLDRFRSMNSYGIVAIATHGEVYFKQLSKAQKERYGWFHLGSQEVLWSGEQVECGKLTEATATCSSDTDCIKFGAAKCMITKASYVGGTAAVSGVCYDANQVDLMSGRVVLGDRTFGVTPAFVLYHGASRRYPNSLVYMGACRTMWNGSLAASFFASGAKAIAGFSNLVTNQFAYQMGEHFFSRMIIDKDKAGSAYGVGAQDPAYSGSFFRFLGARNLTVSESDILNSSFESGDLTAWEKEGDGRVITKLGVAKPVSGKFMGIISTGLGFTQNVGSIEQTFCIPPGLSTFSFYWKYYSEEFNEWCGSQYQDTFTASITANNVSTNIVKLSVDDLCKKGANGCYSCGSKYVGLTPSDVQFDQGDCYKTDWQKATFNISKWSGQGPVTLRFFCEDRGDSIYDTAVLIDHIKFE